MSSTPLGVRRGTIEIAVPVRFVIPPKQETRLPRVGGNRVVQRVAA